MASPNPNPNSYPHPHPRPNQVGGPDEDNALCLPLSPCISLYLPVSPHPRPNQVGGPDEDNAVPSATDDAAGSVSSDP